ncbi:MAG TPA: TRAP transporter large permease subunit, partial [Ilumatobacteraceae bacterium]|nr:TRAP transporter large permease subunit [Ilumatobacteraceae bacterium]
LLRSIGLVMGNLRGGVALAVIVVGTMLAAATGVVAATVIVMGLLSLPTMLKYGYDDKLATGVIVASGTLAQLIPPSIVLILLAQQMQISVLRLFRGALLPGLLLAGLYMLYVVYVALRHPDRAPAMPLTERTFAGVALGREVAVAALPPLLLIAAVLYAIFGGIATPSESGAVGALGALVLAAGNRRLEWKMLRDAAEATSKIVILVMTLLFSSSFFAMVFERLGGQQQATDWLSGVGGGKWGFVIVAMIAVFLLGINLEFLEITFIVVPIFVPAMIALGFSENEFIWFAVLMAINLNIAFISPPVGFSLFYLQGVAPPEVKTSSIHKGALPFMALQVVALVLVLLFPSIVTVLV